MVLALVRSAQRWAGSRQPVNVLSHDQVQLFEPLDSTAPAGAHLLGELRRAGYLLGVDWSHKQPATRDVTILEAAAARPGRQLAELQEWRRGNGVLWVSELLCADDRTPRRRYLEQLREASGADEARLRRIVFGPGCSEAGPTRRVGPAALEVWTTIRPNAWLWVDSAIHRVTSVVDGRVRARGSTRCDTEATNRINFWPGEAVDIAKHEAPLLVDTAELAGDGSYAMDADEPAQMAYVAVMRDALGLSPTAPSSTLHAMTGEATSAAEARPLAPPLTPLGGAGGAPGLRPLAPLGAVGGARPGGGLAPLRPLGS